MRNRWHRNPKTHGGQTTKRIVILRLGHRPTRDKRITTHVCLVARAFGAEGVYIDGQRDNALENSIARVVASWGGNFWTEFIQNPIKIVKEWKNKGGKVAHLTMYGLPLSKVKDQITSSNGDTLVVIGGEKVPRYYYSEADFNVAVGNQPHSEVAALAILLDRMNGGSWESSQFGDGQLKIIPSEHGKKVEQLS